MKLTHIRVPGRNSTEHLASIRDAYISGTLDLRHIPITTLVFEDKEPFWIGARYSHPQKKADIVVSDIAEEVDVQVRTAIRAGLKEFVIATDARFVVVVADERGVSMSSDKREAKARANATFFSRELWDIQSYGWRFRNWSRPRLVIYDYDGQDGRKVWSWVFHFGPWRFIRERYAL